MPCRNDGDDHSGYDYECHRQKEMFKASLCAVLSALERVDIDIFNGPELAGLPVIDWEEAGVTKKELKTWWKVHKQEDEKRRAEIERKINAEQQHRINEARKREILAKLTPEEREILGVKS